ncbi:hypothetical protein HBB16_02950 [Pseudonocardia sp. MCCB 268]|nr:hypothetical protein [Pseudonocardia cytotoxica]
MGGAGWRVTRVLPPETSAPAARSLLVAPGVDVRAGTCCWRSTAPRSTRTGAPRRRWCRRPGAPSSFTARSGPTGLTRTVRRVVVRPLRSEAELRYQTGCPH